jgi:sigma-B regulation protein RsbU (phosphoserine phosphatase)
MPHALVGTVNHRSLCHFLKDGSQTVGRAATSDLHVEDPSVSRSHAEVVVSGDTITIADLGSRNGTRVNGKAIDRPTPLSEGDRIDLADVALRLVDTKPPAQTIYADDASSLESSSVSIDEIYSLGIPKTDDESRNLFRILADAGELLAAQRPLDELYHSILDLIERALTSDRTVLLLVDDANSEPVATASRVSAGVGERGLVLSKTMVQKVMSERTSLLTTDAQQDPRFQEQQSVMTQGIRSAMVAPLFDNENVIGALYADTTDPASWYTKDELRTFTALANLIAVKITQARHAAAEEERRRLERELMMAKDILSHILPTSCAKVAGYELCAYHEPCSAVGGDLYDVRQMTDGRYLFLTGDVAGKGLPAALRVSNIMPIIQLLTDEPPVLADVAARLNRQIWRSTDPVHFATLFLGILDPASGQIDYVNAGHNPPLCVSAEGICTEVHATGLPIGMIEETQYSAGSINLERGGLFVVFSDGIPEAQNADGDFYGDDRLSDLLCRTVEQHADTIVETLKTDLESFVQDCPPSDDVTVLLVRRLPTS